MSATVVSKDFIVKRDIFDMLKIMSEHIEFSEEEASELERKLDNVENMLDEQKWAENQR